VGDNVEVLSTLPTGAIVAVRQGNILGISFHPEITGENRVHQYFVDEMVGA
jgi:5'-phosphate synthase pdxT subunit